jgi:hypothetical protein
MISSQPTSQNWGEKKTKKKPVMMERIIEV